METAIGVFASRAAAEAAVMDLSRHGVPEPAIVFLTRAESDRRTTGGRAVSVADSTTLMFVPGVGQVLALGLRAAALLGLAGAATGVAPGKAVPLPAAAQPTPDERCSEDVDFFRDVLKQGRSLVVVRTESAEVAKTASRTLDRLGLGLRPLSPAKMQAVTRQVGGIAIVDISGKIAHGEGNVRLRELVHGLLARDQRRILLNLGQVHYIDSSGMGELVRLYTTIRDQGGQVKLVNPSGRVQGLLQMTRLNAVFQIESNEEAAIASFGSDSSGAP